MADNYLEKKMEEHRLRQMAPSRHSAGQSRPRAGTLTVKFDPLRVFVDKELGEYGEAIVKRMTAAGCRVAFAGTDTKTGGMLAQATGARFYPLTQRYGIGDAVKDVHAHWGGLDVVVIGDAAAFPHKIFDIEGLRRIILVGHDTSLPDVVIRDGLTVNAVSTAGITPADAAQFCLYLCLPSSSFIDRQEFIFA